MDNRIKKCLFSVFTTSNTVFCGTSCPDLQKNQEDAFKHNVSEKEKEIIEKLKKIFNLDDKEIVGLSLKSFVDGSLTFLIGKTKINDGEAEKTRNEEFKKVDKLIEEEMKNEENKDYYVYFDHISFLIEGKAIGQNCKSTIYILIKNAKKIDDKKFKLYKFDDTKEKDQNGNIIDSEFKFAKNFKFTNYDLNKEIYIKKADIDALDKQN